MMDSNILFFTICAMVLIAAVANVIHSDRSFWLKYYKQSSDDNFDFAMRIIDSIRADK